MGPRLVVILVLICACLPACQKEVALTPVFHAEGYPARLSDWRLLTVEGGRLQLASSVIAYDLNTPLFTDYAHKLRTVWLPAGTAATYQAADTFDFPVGTVISKTFYYPTQAALSSQQVLKADDQTDQRLLAEIDLGQVKLIETRLLVHRAEGWVALPYVWDEAETDAVLKRVGDIKQLELVAAGAEAKQFSYVVPNQNQCAGCHATNATTRAVKPIGPKARHLNKDYTYAAGRSNQLEHWAALGLLVNLPDRNTRPANVDWKDTSSAMDERARSYLDINCSHCHNAVGPADTSGLLLEPSDPIGPSLGVCKLPIAAGTGTGDRKYGIVPGQPDQSIFTYRLASTRPSEMMPELGRSLSHDEGVALITQWIAQMQGECG